MKKVIIVLLIAIVIPASIFAGRGLFDLTVGVAASSTYDIQAVKDGELSNFTMQNLTFGADAEVKLAFVAVDAKAMYNAEAKSIYGNVSANLALDIFFFRVKAGLGYQYSYNTEDKSIIYGNASSTADSFDKFKDAGLDINVGLDVLLGDLTVGAFATLPTETTISNGDWAGIVKNASDHWSKAKLGVMVGIALL